MHSALARPAGLRFLPLLICLLWVSSASALSSQIVSQSEQSIRVRVDLSDLRVEPRTGEDGLRSLPVSAGATLMQEGSRTWLSAPLLLAVPPGTRPSLRVLEEERVQEDWPAPPRLGSDSLTATAGGPERAGLRLLDLGWQRSQKVQRLAVDVAVHEGGWSRLRSLEFELLFTPDPGERERLSQSAPDPRRAWRESPVFETLLEKQVLNAEQARAWRLDPRRLQAGSGGALSSLNPALDDDWIVRIMVDHDGLIKVSGQDLKQAGVELGGIDPATLSLWEGEREVPLYLQDGGDGDFREGDYLVFVGRARVGDAFPTDFFSPENAYFLTWGHSTGRRFAERGAAPQDGLADQTEYRHLLHAEKSRLWTSLKGVSLNPMETDHWQWLTLEAVNEPATFVETVTLENPLGGQEGRLDHVRFSLRGESEATTTGADHHVIVRMDGQWVGDLEASHRNETISNWFPLAPGQLAGQERPVFEFHLPLDRGQSADLCYLNWLEVQYRRSLSLQANGQLHLPVEQVEEANQVVSGLTSDNLLVLSEDGWILRGARPVLGRLDAQRLHLAGVEGDVFVSELGRLLGPARIVRHANARLRDPDQQADMLIIAPSQFHEVLQDLVEYHSQSMSVKLVDIEAVYSEFNHGLMHTRALQDFLVHSFQQWQSPAPSYLTLVGRASRANGMAISYSPRYHTQVPTWWVQTATSGATATDENFTYLVGADSLWDGDVLVDVVPDTFQDLLVGRISVYTPGQLSDYLEKHREYRELTFPGVWMETQVMAADEGNDQVFEVGNELVSRTIVPAAYPVSAIHVRQESPYHGGALDFIDLYNAGCTVLNYNGHGAIGILSSRSLFRATDIRYLTNRGKYPISFAWSCLVGYFDDPDSASMAELLLRKADAGSIAFYGSTAKATINVDNPLMMNYFYNQYAEEALSLGQIVQLTENNLLLTGNTSDIIHMYNLQGDPALIPAFPRKRLRPEPGLLSLAGGAAAQFTLRTDPPGLSGTLEGTFLPFAHEPSNFQGSNLRRYSQTFTDGEVVSLALPLISEPRESKLLLAMNTSQGRAVGVLPLFINTPYAGTGSHSPTRGLANAPLQFRFESPLDVDSVQVLTNLYNPSLASMWMSPLGPGVFVRQLDLLPSGSSGQYYPLSEAWLQNWGVEVEDFPYFQSSGLMYRFRIYDGEDWTDSDGDDHYGAGDAYTDANGNGQYDPPGEPFVDEEPDGVWRAAEIWIDTATDGRYQLGENYVDANSNGRWDVGESFTDRPSNGVYDLGEYYVDRNGDGSWTAAESYTDLNGNGLYEAWIDLGGTYVSILEEERIQAVDTLLTVAQGTEGLLARLRWTASVAQSLDQVSARLERQDGSGWQPLWSGRIAAAAGTQVLEAPVDLAPGSQRLRCVIGPLWSADSPLLQVDSLRLNDEFTLLTPQAGSGGALALGSGSHWTLELPAGQLQGPVQLDPNSHPHSDPGLREEEQGQPGLGLLIGSTAAPNLRALDLAPRPVERVAADLHPAGATLSCRVPLGAQFQFPDAVLGDSLPLALARWIPERGLWVVQPGSATAGEEAWQVQANASLLDGWWLPVALRDQQGPSLAVQAAGQWFAPGDMVPAEPVFQIQLNDPDGLDLGEGLGAPQLLLDGELVPAEQVQVGEGTTGVLLQWSPGVLEAGSEHSLLLRARDALGNLTELSTPFQVATRLQLEFFANHPNPFQDETTFAWQLSNVPRSLRFEIFTASGRLVRRIPVPTPRIGYDEYTWDGRDQQGRQVANGVYFLRVVADGSQSIDEVHKLARLR